MPKFIEETLENLDTDSDIENLLWINAAFEIPDFSDEEPDWHKSEAEIELDGHVW